MDPNEAKYNAIPEYKIIKMKFKIGMAFDVYGRCQGMLCAQRKHKRFVFIERQLLERIMNTYVGMSDLLERVTDDYNQFRDSSHKVW